MHYLFFDGTSYFVGDISDKTDDETIIIDSGTDLDELSQMAEDMNEEMYL